MDPSGTGGRGERRCAGAGRTRSGIAPALRPALRHQGQHRLGRSPHDGRLSRLSVRAGAERGRRGAADRGGRDSRRQDQPGPVRDGVGRHTLALWRAQQCLRSALYFRRLQLRLGSGCGGGPGQLLTRHGHGRLRPRAGSVQQYRRPQALARADLEPGRRARLPQPGLRVDLRAYRGRRSPGAARGRGL